MPDFSPRRSAMEKFLPQFASANDPPHEFGEASSPPVAVEANGNGHLEIASDAASVWIAVANGNSVADAFASDLLHMNGGQNGNGHALANGHAAANGHADQEEMESGEVELLALDDVVDANAAESIEELVADRELVGVVAGDEDQFAHEGTVAIDEHSATATDEPDQAWSNGATAELNDAQPDEESLSAAPVVPHQERLNESIRSLPPETNHSSSNGAAGASHPVAQPTHKVASSPEHPATGSLFSPYLVTEVPDLRKRADRRRSWWRRLFG